MISGTFHSLWTSRFLSGVIFLLPEGHMVLSSLLVMNTFSFCMFEKLFILPSWLKDTFAGFRIMGFWFFFFIFHVLKIQFHCLLSGIAFYDIAIIFIDVPLTPSPLVFHPLDSGVGAPLSPMWSSLVHSESPHSSPLQCTCSLWRRAPALIPCLADDCPCRRLTKGLFLKWD